MEIKLSWTQIKAKVTETVTISYTSAYDNYYLFLSEPGFNFICVLTPDNTADVADFETNYKAGSTEL